MTSAPKAKSVRQAEGRQAARRVEPVEDPTLPPSPDEIWACAWFALHVWPQWEWRVRSELLDLGYAIFLPVETRWNATRCRVRRAYERPLLTRYEFVGVPKGRGPRAVLSDEDWAALRHVEGVKAVVGHGGRPLPVPIENLVQLAGEIVSGVYDETRSATFRAGESIGIAGGPFAGFTGVSSATVPADAALSDPIAVLMRIMGAEQLVHLPLEHLRKIV